MKHHTSSLRQRFEQERSKKTNPSENKKENKYVPESLPPPGMSRRKPTEFQWLGEAEGLEGEESDQDDPLSMRRKTENNPPTAEFQMGGGGDHDRSRGMGTGSKLILTTAVIVAIVLTGVIIYERFIQVQPEQPKRKTEDDNEDDKNNNDNSHQLEAKLPEFKELDECPSEKLESRFGPDIAILEFQRRLKSMETDQDTEEDPFIHPAVNHKRKKDPP